MAHVEIGGTTFEMVRRNTSEWNIWTRVQDDALGPHFGLQKDTRLIYISPTEDEARALLELCKAILGL